MRLRRCLLVRSAVVVEDVRNRVPDAVLGVPDGVSHRGRDPVGDQRRGYAYHRRGKREAGSPRFAAATHLTAACGCGRGMKWSDRHARLSLNLSRHSAPRGRSHLPDHRVRRPLERAASRCSEANRCQRLDNAPLRRPAGSATSAASTRRRARSISSAESVGDWRSSYEMSIRAGTIRTPLRRASGRSTQARL